LLADALVEERELRLAVAQVDAGRGALHAVGRERRSRVEQHLRPKWTARCEAERVELAELPGRNDGVRLGAQQFLPADADDSSGAGPTPGFDAGRGAGEDADPSYVVDAGLPHRIEDRERR